MGTKVPPHSARKRKLEENNPRTLKRKRLAEDLDSLERKVSELDANGDIKSFSELPLSQATSSGLDASHFKKLTDIQTKAIPLALQGSDILGAAKTGSGKTLAFLVPVLENLHRKKWTEHDGLGALILSPTRELAIQIFEVLRKIGRYHTFSAGLVIGGKSLQEERERLGRMNILVCTPGRMLQHMDQTAALEVDNLQMLVLDEADRILDMGFQTTIDAIVEHLPRERQTLLFSATQTKKVGDLARLSLKDPEYVSVHESAASATPSTLQQHYVVTPLQEKLDTLWSFIRSNLKAKILVFISSGKQVRFVYESFRHLQPGIPLLHLHGRQKQTARLDITTKFGSSRNSCLFATDVVARGLDFPAVDWVIQFDCPEDADTYIHRVGRTARFERNGRAVLFLDPREEEGMLARLAHKKVPIEQIKVRQKKQQSIRHQLQNMCFKDPELKYLGQKAFVSYTRSVHIQKDKEIFDVQKLPLEEFAASLGLPGAPKIRFRKGEDAKARKNAPRQQAGMSSSDEDDDEEDREKNSLAAAKKSTPATRTKYDRMFERRNQDVLSSHYKTLREEDETSEDEHNDQEETHPTQSSASHAIADADSDNDFLTVKRRLSSTSASPPPSATFPKPVPHLPLGPTLAPLPIDSKRRAKLLKSKKAVSKLQASGTKLVFDDDGNPHSVYELEDEAAFRTKGEPAIQRQKFLEEERERVRVQDEVDREVVRERRREVKAKWKERRKVERGMERAENSSGEAVLVPYEGDGEMEGGDGDEAEPGLEEKRERKELKAPKKWFQDSSDFDSDGDDANGSTQKQKKQKQKQKQNKKGKNRDEVEDAETLEELEELARGYL